MEWGSWSIFYDRKTSPSGESFSQYLQVLRLFAGKLVVLPDLLAWRNQINQSFKNLWRVLDD